ncbi:MAG: VCBS repeat-containing protein [Ignavibacteriales bacterium]|nr:VCBS repeat-containing protein [Ignavibacteriales bacterium]
MIRVLSMCLICVTFLFAQHSQRNQQDYSLIFDGKSSYAEVPFSAALNPEDNFTVEMWVNLNAWTKDFQSPLSSRDYLLGYNFYATRYVKRWTVIMGSGVDWSAATGPEVVLNEWTHLAMTYGDRMMSFYVNGILVGIVNTQLKQNTRAPLRFGMSSVDAAYHFNGAIDEVRIWNTVRTSGELLRSMMTEIDPSDTLLIGYWKFDEGSGTIIRDVTGNGHDAKIVANAQWKLPTRSTEQGILSIAASTITFPNIAVGDYALRSFTVSNNGRSPVHILSAGIDNENFSAELPRTELMPGHTKQIDIVFRPTSSGKKNAQLTLKHSGLGGSIPLYLSGTSELPSIVSIMPDSGASGETITINGTFFGFSKENADVFIGNSKATIVSISPHTIEAEIPYGIITSKITPLSLRIGAQWTAARKPFRVISSEEGMINERSFEPAATLRTDEKPSAVVSADFNNDGKPDIAVLHPSSISIWKSVYSVGTFDSSSMVRGRSLSTGRNPGDMITADFDNDGLFDLAVTNPDTGTVSIFRNISTGKEIIFEPSKIFPAWKGVREMSVADFDGNGLIDLIVTTFNTSWIIVLQNLSTNGGLKFESHVNGFWNLPLYLTTGYLNDDALPDIAVTNNLDHNVYLMKGIEEFNKPLFLGQDSYAAARMTGRIGLTDVDGDAKPDLLSLDVANMMYVYRNMSDSAAIRFTDKVTFTTEEEPSDIAYTDLNGDGKPEIVVSNRRKNSVSVFQNRSEQGVFSPAMLSQNFDFTVGAGPGSVVLADVDLDGKPDIITANGSDNTISILRNNVNTSRDWFLISYITLAGIVIVGGSGWFITNRRLKRKVQKLEQEKMIERERTRIARDMHDDLGARLTKISILLGMADRDVNDASAMGKHIGTLSSATRDVEQAMDEVIWSVDPKYDTLASLFNYIVQYTQEYLEPTEIRLRFDIPTNIPHRAINADERHTIFSIVKESLNNTAKYADATEVRITVSFSDEHVHISITDNGKGFDVETIPDFHHGVKNMKERMTAMNGICTIESETGKGTTVKIEFKK